MTSSDLLERLRSTDPAIQAPAIVEAQKSRAYHAAPVIADLLSSSDDAIRSSAADCLGYLGIKAPSRYGAALLPLLTDREAFVRSCAAESLGALRYEPAISSLGRLLISDGDELVRTCAAEALAAFDGRQVLLFAQGAIDDPDPTVRANAVRVIGLRGDETSRSMLDERLNKETAFQPRAALLGAVWLLGSPEALPRLLELLEGADIVQSTIVLNVVSDVIREASASSIVRDAAAFRDALARSKQRDELVGRHADTVLNELAKRLGATPN
ncbi:MAG: HEAT repeat domain-containing protein [Candidatus Dormibacteraeota bacterium]|nr:HEAT repeat domain-containing protein [Candidatus Dormibacteraeota bacterium]